VVWNLSRAGDVRGDPGTFTLEEAENLRAALFVPDPKGKSDELVTVHFEKAEFQVRRWKINREGKPDPEELKLDGPAKGDPGRKDPNFSLAADGSAVAVTSEKNTVEVYRIPPAKKE